MYNIAIIESQNAGSNFRIIVQEKYVTNSSSYNINLLSE